MPDNEQKIESIARAVERYLSEHEAAADSMENIAKWWLRHQRYHEAVEAVQKALDLLIARGRIDRTKNADGVYIYRKP